MAVCKICGCDTILLKNKEKYPIYYCKHCRYYFCGEIDTSVKYSIYEHYEYSLMQLRMCNYNKILKKLSKILPQGATGLEVGSALGWFLEKGVNQGYNMVGIEPITVNYQKSLGKDFTVINGFFPNDIPNNYYGAFDFIIFNDVLEHIPDVANSIRSCHVLLNKSGYLIVNIPLNTGIFFNIATLLSAFGTFGPLKRLWQFETESPHLHYFSSKSIKKLITNSGFDYISNINLKTLSSDIKSTYERISGIGRNNKVKSIFLTLITIVTLPFLNILPKDVKCFIFKKENVE